GLPLAWFCAASAVAHEAEAKDQAAPAAPDDLRPAEGAADAAAGGLAQSQEQVERKYLRFEQVLLRMSELTSATDPKRAALLRKAVARSKDQQVGTQIAQLVDLLKRDQLAGAAGKQQAVEQDLAQLLELLLSEQRSDRLKSERERIKQQIQRVNELIKKQQQLQGQTESGGDAKKLSEGEAKLADQTGKLAEEMKDPNESPPAGKQTPAKNGHSDDQDGEPQEKDGRPKESDDPPDAEKSPDEKSPGEKSAETERPTKPGDSDPSQGDGSEQQKPKDAKPSKGEPKPSPSPSGDSPQPSESSDDASPPPSDNEVARQRVREAREAMDQARQKLEKAEREGALADQDEARSKLEQAKARLEEILRQLREEEVERTLALLEARFRKMLQMENEVYEGTVRVDRVPADDRGRNEEIEAGRLGRKQRSVLDELRGAETLLHEDGSSVAFPEAVAQLREDMETVAGRLAQAKVDALTQATEKDIIAALEEMIAAFQKAQKDQQEQQQRQGQQQAGEQQEPPLVDQLAELRMIRALQMRVNKRTQEYARLVSGDEGQADQPELLEALEKLSQREARIHRATRDIVLGKNQ
ncbi:MAG TPA: hypothetical protein VFW87_13130, partial [Pirellulales bacterium]|nr:hypothetical protein [Pirellulales bacterium]